MLPLKKFLFAVAAATSFSCGVFAANPPPRPQVNFPQEVRIAFNAIFRELDRRLDPGNGQPLRPDRPSGVAATPEEAAALSAVFGTEQPLNIKRSGSGYAFTLPGQQYQQDETSVSWSAIPVQLTVDASGSATASKWASVKFHGPVYDAVFDNIELRSSQRRATTMDGLQLTAGHLRVEDRTSNGAITAEEVSYRVSTTKNKNKLDQQYQFSSKHALIDDDMPIDNLHLAFAILGLNGKAPPDRQADARALRSPTLSLLAIANHLSLPGASLKLDDLSANVGGGQIRLRGALRLSGAVATNGATAADIANALDMRLEVEVAQSSLRFLALQMARQSAGQARDPLALDQQAETLYAFALGKLLAGGYATLEKEKLSSLIELREGKLSINGKQQAMTAEDLLGLAERMTSPSSQTPTPPPPPMEQDHSAPVEVRWQDRSLEHLQLYALNDTSGAVHELCLRHARAQEAEQAQDWCAKAKIDLADISDSKPEPTPAVQDGTVERSVEAGFYYESFYRFDPSKVRRLHVSLKNPQQHNKWMPMAGICLKATAPSDKACLNLSYYRDTGQMNASSRLIAADGKSDGARLSMERDFKVNDALAVTIAVENGQVHFWLGDGDEDELAQDMTFPAEEISLICSTADCQFKFD